MNYSSDSLVSTIRLRAGIPAEGMVSDAQILEAINYELRQTILPLVIEAGAEYYVTYEDIAVNASGEYRIPEKAVGKKLRDVQIVINTTDLYGYSMPQITLPNLANNFNFQENYYNNQKGFVVIGNKIRFYPANQIQTGYLRMYYYRRPNECVTVADGATITVINSTQFTIGAIPAGWSVSPQIDIIESIPSFDVIGENIASSRSGSTFTISDTSDYETGQHVNLTGETSYPQMPVDLQNMLIQSVCMRMYEIMRDEQRLMLASQMFDKMKVQTMKLISPRVDGRTPKIISNNNIGRYV